jgi:hypothetical protein
MVKVIWQFQLARQFEYNLIMHINLMRHRQLGVHMYIHTYLTIPTHICIRMVSASASGSSKLKVHLPIYLHTYVQDVEYVVNFTYVHTLMTKVRNVSYLLKAWLSVGQNPFTVHAQGFSK